MILLFNYYYTKQISKIYVFSSEKMFYYFVNRYHPYISSQMVIVKCNNVPLYNFHSAYRFISAKILSI